MDFSKATILITGGNSGIGRGLAEALAMAGAQIIITGRNAASLAETLAANPKMTGYRLDVSQTADLKQFAAMVIERHPRLNAVINNAGMMAIEDVLNAPTKGDIVEQTVATNFLGPVLLTMALLPHLSSQSEAAVIMMSSGLAFVPRAATPTYGATKAAIHSWTVSLRHQLRNTKVEVVEIVPPLVATNFAPGQASNPNAMALDAFISEAVALLCADETPKEVLVQRALPQRIAESSGHFDAVFSLINPG